VRASADHEALLDVEGVAARLNLSVRHVRRLVAERRIPFLKVGSLLRFDPEQIDAWLRSLTICGFEVSAEAETLPQPPRLGAVRQLQVGRRSGTVAGA